VIGSKIRRSDEMAWLACLEAACQTDVFVCICNYNIIN